MTKNLISSFLVLVLLLLVSGRNLFARGSDPTSGSAQSTQTVVTVDNPEVTDSAQVRHTTEKLGFSDANLAFDTDNKLAAKATLECSTPDPTCKKCCELQSQGDRMQQHADAGATNPFNNNGFSR